VGAREGVGVPARAGVGVVPRGGESGTGFFMDTEGGGRGERARRIVGAVRVGEGEEEEREREREDVDGWLLVDESVRVPVGADTLRRVRVGRSGVGAESGVFRPERTGSSGVLPGDDRSVVPSAASGGAGVPRAEREGTSVTLEVGSDALGAGARIGTCGGTFSNGFGTRSASKMKRKSRPNS
jgi:hypothetical protein